MKPLLVSFAVASLAVLPVQAQQPLQAAQNAGVKIQGTSIQLDGTVSHVQGNATFSTDSIEIRADQMNFNSATGELEAIGHVTVVSTPSVLPSATVSRPELQPQIDAAQTRLTRSQELFARGLLGVADLERAQQQLNQLKLEASRSSVAPWTMQTDQLKMQMRRTP